MLRLHLCLPVHLRVPLQPLLLRLQVVWLQRLPLKAVLLHLTCWMTYSAADQPFDRVNEKSRSYLLRLFFLRLGLVFMSSRSPTRTCMCVRSRPGLAPGPTRERVKAATPPLPTISLTSPLLMTYLLPEVVQIHLDELRQGDLTDGATQLLVDPLALG